MRHSHYGELSFTRHQIKNSARTPLDFVLNSCAEQEEQRSSRSSASTLLGGKFSCSSGVLAENSGHSEVLIPTVHGMEERGKVVRRKRDRDGNPIGTANRNPLLDTRLYEVQFPDG
eukprot:scaffold14709_cov91-Cyclotella_meneghiniana.AAC.3